MSQGKSGTTHRRRGLTIGDLCKLADVHERNAYKAIERLIALGLVEEIDVEEDAGDAE